MRLLAHADSEHTLQFTLVMLTRHIIMHPEDACVLVDTYGGKALPKLVNLLDHADSELTLRSTCQLISLCSRDGGTHLKHALLHLDTMELLVQMVTPPLKLEEKTALFCLSAMTACATDKECRDKLKRAGIRRVLEAIGSSEGESRDFEFLRRAASNTLASCTEPFHFDDGSPELTQALIVSDIVAGNWKVNMWQDD